MRERTSKSFSSIMKPSRAEQTEHRGAAPRRTNHRISLGLGQPCGYENERHFTRALRPPSRASAPTRRPQACCPHWARCARWRRTGRRHAAPPRRPSEHPTRAAVRPTHDAAGAQPRAGSGSPAGPGEANARTARTHQTPALLFQPDSPQDSPQGWGLGELQ
jgi:hypothetical protein